MKLVSVCLAVALLGLVGCAQTPTKVISSTPRTVIVDSLFIERATPVAEKECLKYGRHARFTAATMTSEFIFDCIE